MERELVIGCIIFGILLNVHDASCISCFHCEGTQHVRDCFVVESIKMCLPDEACYMEKRINLETGRDQYYAGCRNIQLCNLDSCQKAVFGNAHSRAIADLLTLPVCTECCYDNNCNIELCGAKIPPNITQCFNCRHMHDASICTQTIDCDLRLENCLVMKTADGMFDLKCINKRFCGLLLEADDVSNETRCCDTHLCNGNPITPKLDKGSIFKSFTCPPDLVKPRTTTVKQTVTTTTVKSTPTSTTVKPRAPSMTVTTKPTFTTATTMPTFTPVETAKTTKIVTFLPTHTTVKTTQTAPTVTTHTTYKPTPPPTGTSDMTSTNTLLCASNVITNCTFDDGVLCGWAQMTTDNFDWTFQSGPTMTDDTGLDNDHTIGSGQGKYLYVESSAPRSFGEYASLASPVMLAGDTTILQFWYFMYGAGIGSLVVNLTDKSSNQVELLKIEGDHGQKWINATISIPGWKVPNDYRIIITAFVGSSYTGDIAIDDLIISKNRCRGQALSTIYADVTSPPHLFQTTPTNSEPVSTSIPRTTPIATTQQFTDATSSSATTMPELCDHFLRKGVVNCTFDSGICFWAQQRNDNFDWTLQNGAMLTDHAGPVHDHTLGTGLGKYLYIKPSASRLHNEYTNMISPVFHYSHALYFEFWYFMLGSGRLFVYLKDKMSQQEVELLAIEGNQIEKWTKAAITLNAQQDIPPELNDYMLVITVYVGQDYGGGIAIDDLVIIEGTCDGNVGGSLIIG